MKKRIEGLDIAKGICILLVIAGHVLGADIPEIGKYGESLRMPFFFIISGFFFKQYSDKFLLERNARRLLLPYLATVGVIVLRTASKIRSGGAIPKFLAKAWAQVSYGAVLPVAKSKSIYGMEAPPVGPVWFLICLFCAMFLFHLVVKLPSYVARIGVIAGAIVAVIFINRYIYLPLDLDTAIIALPLILVGYYFKQIDILHKIIINEHNKKAIGLVVLALIVYIVSNYYSVAGIGSRVYTTLPLTYLGGVAGFIFLLNLSEYLVRFKTLNKVLTFYGKETLVILCIHSLDLFIHYPDFFGNHIYFFVFWRIAVVTAGIFIIRAIPFLKKIFYNLEMQAAKPVPPAI